MILCVGTTPAAQRVMVFRQLKLDAVNRATTTIDGAAGKSINVAKVLQVLGERPRVVGFLGGDRGRELEALLRARGLDMDFVRVATPTRQCITVIDEATGHITELVEESRPVDPGDYDKLLAIVQQTIGRCRAIVLSGTIASGGPADLYLRCIHLAKDGGVLSVADAAGAALQHALKGNPGLVKPNRAELEATLGKALPDQSALLGAMRELHTRGAQRVVVTAGEAPTLAYDGKNAFRVMSPKVKALNPIGSGDAFTAALTWKLLQGVNLGEACRWASAAGAANALTLMAGEVEPADIERLVGQVSVETI